MKTLSKFGMAMLAMLALAGCGSKKQATTTTNNYPASNTQAELPGKRMMLPCVDASMDDDDYFRDLGIGTSINKQSARKAAVEASKSMIKSRLGGMIKGVATDYSRVVAGQAPADKVQRLIEEEFTQVVEKMLNDADKTCEDMYQVQSGEFESYYAIQISKKEIINKVSNVLSKNEELEIEFNREQFRKFVEKRMAEVKQEE